MWIYTEGKYCPRSFEAVKDRLFNLSNVNGVISKLKMLFGQPEAIVHLLILIISNYVSLQRSERINSKFSLISPSAFETIARRYPKCL